MAAVEDDGEAGLFTRHRLRAGSRVHEIFNMNASRTNDGYVGRDQTGSDRRGGPPTVDVVHNETVHSRRPSVDSLAARVARLVDEDHALPYRRLTVNELILSGDEAGRKRTAHTRYGVHLRGSDVTRIPEGTKTPPSHYREL